MKYVVLFDSDLPPNRKCEAACFVEIIWWVGLGDLSTVPVACTCAVNFLFLSNGCVIDTTARVSEATLLVM